MLFKGITFVVVLGLIILNIIYRVEIVKISRQLDFINRNETNKTITQDVEFKEITRLVDELNELIGIHRDITREYKIKDEALKETITNISHDIRTPLTSLNGYFQLLVESESPEEKRRYMDIIQIRINHLKNLLEDMFTYLKIQDPDYELQKQESEDCNISNIVQDNLFSYYEEFNEKEIEPDISISEKPIVIKSNSIAIDRIVYNLISNSLIHGERYIGITLFEEDNTVSLIVKNDVHNIEDIDLDNIFTRFYKNDKSRTTDSTGLGLTIAKELVEAMGGKISARIEGEIFSIKIDLHK